MEAEAQGDGASAQFHSSRRAFQGGTEASDARSFAHDHSARGLWEPVDKDGRNRTNDSDRGAGIRLQTEKDWGC